MTEAEGNNPESASRIDMPESSAQTNEPSEITNEAVNSTMTEAEGNNPESGITNGETNRCWIFKVQDVTRVDEDSVRSFKPKILSIGPYHHGSLGLEDMESKKLICQRNILGSNGENNDGHRIMTLARGFYPENIVMGEVDFAGMLLLDGCFILATLGVMKGRDLSQLITFSKHDIEHDLLLVENQIPFCVLEEIHNLAVGEGETNESLKGKIVKYVEGVLQYYPKAIQISENPSNDFYHLLHLCHMFFQPSKKSAERQSDQAVTNLQWRRAVRYHEAGVKFRVKKSSTPHSLLDVTFSNGTLKIPRLSIDANTESIFRNLIMFERGCLHVGNYINAYVTFMAQLLNNADDVDLLVRGGIIEILGREEEILNVFSRLNGLAVMPSWDNNYLKSTHQPAEAHYNRRFNWWFAWLKHNHLTNPCVALAALGGFIVLICSVIQALFAILQFFIPTK